ncbi:nucleotidyl transferase AbiEii/AbiGii toxin family protein [Haliangium sp. UPWRP_2]|uniref:nucleotidyl transferase AbiEii/AbiGii toxin family protein n=1 Tax=Haliangium sp. UPWRP_2 TaxID=1931276 RepID=UPI000B540B9E|nr:nucleotidyl transferase AbiEii/AbiGii toxin family protein [Haliangium sp. UPWRP_2]PSM32294.1 hypothetical protein BVG81_000855 [Haliangium sp. UPWRP_2]
MGAAVKSQLEVALRQAALDLSGLGVNWALVGGLAVSARAEPRFTRDIDLAVAVADDQEAQSLVASLQGRGYRVLALIEHTKTGRMAIVRLGLPSEGDRGVVIDLLLAACGIEAEIAAHAEPLELFPGFIVPVARSSHLVAMKLVSMDDPRRSDDRRDILSLFAEFSDEEQPLLIEAIRLIADRGYSRGRDLMQLYQQFQQPPGSESA